MVIWIWSKEKCGEIERVGERKVRMLAELSNDHKELEGIY